MLLRNLRSVYSRVWTKTRGACYISEVLYIIRKTAFSCFRPYVRVSASREKKMLQRVIKSTGFIYLRETDVDEALAMSSQSRVCVTHFNTSRSRDRNKYATGLLLDNAHTRTQIQIIRIKFRHCGTHSSSDLNSNYKTQTSAILPESDINAINVEC